MKVTKIISNYEVFSFYSDKWHPVISSDPPRMPLFISSSAVAPRDVELTDVSAGRQGLTALIFAHAVMIMSLV